MNVKIEDFGHKRNGREIVACVGDFTVVLPFLRVEYEALRVIASCSPLRISSDEYFWSFPISRIREVEIVLEGKNIVFDKEQLVEVVIPRCEPLYQEVLATMHKKGGGSVGVVVEDEVYVVVWYERGIEKSWRVSRSLVDFIWENVIGKMEVGHDNRKRSPFIAERIIKALGEVGLGKHHWDIDDIVLDEDDNKDKVEKNFINQGRWNYARSGSFNWKYFNGDRSHYFNLYYYPMKVLQGLGVICFSRNGYITKITGDYVRQKRVREIELMDVRAKKNSALSTSEDVGVWNRYGGGE